MRITIDYREALRAKRTGKGQWTKGFVAELLKRQVECDLLVDSDSGNTLPGATFTVFRPGIRWHFSVARYLQSLPDTALYISPTSFIVPFLVGKRVRTIPVVHDLIAWRREPHDKKAIIIEKLLLPRVLTTATHICTVSSATKTDLVDQFPFIDSASVSPIFAGPHELHPPRNTPDGKTILCAATLCPRKNQLRLIQAYTLLPSELRDAYNLVLIGARGWNDSEIVSLAQTTPGVTWKNYVSDEQYLKLLSTCTVFALPSLYEGFGMQILDALQRGIPVLTSNKGSLAEVAGEAACIADPLSTADISAKLQHMLEDSEFRRVLAEKGPSQAEAYSWTKTVDLFLDIVERAAYTT